MRVYRNCDGQFELPAELKAAAGDMLRTTHLDGLELPVAKIFAG